MDCSTQKNNQRVISSLCLEDSLEHPLEHHESAVQADKIRSSSAIWLTRLGNLLFRQSDEIQVWQRSDRNGQLWWYAYNPKTRHSGVFESESEIRVWIERQLRL